MHREREKPSRSDVYLTEPSNVTAVTKDNPVDLVLYFPPTTDREIVEDLEADLEQFREIMTGFGNMKSHEAPASPSLEFSLS